MNILFSYTIYITLLLSVLASVVLARKKRSTYVLFDISNYVNINKYYIIGIIILSFIIGYRFDVGEDWYTYVLYFERGTFTGFQREIGYRLLNTILYEINANYTHLFFIIAFLSWYNIYKSFPKELIVLGLFFFLTDHWLFMSMNIIRQFLAMTFVLLSLKFIVNKNTLKAIIIIATASLFHRTALLFLPLIFIPWDIFKSRGTIWFLLFVASLFISQTNYIFTVVEQAFVVISSKFQIFSIYENYLFSEYFEAQEIETSGFVILFKNALYLYILLYYKRIVAEYPKSKIYFILYFTGSILSILFLNVLVMTRLADYFLMVRPIVLSLIINHIWKNPKNSLELLITLLIILAYCIIFLRTIIIYPYNFTFLN